MKLPNANVALVEREKITGYLLDSSHRFGVSKARFFMQFGFRVEDWETLAEAFREHARQHEVSKEIATGFGSRYEIDAEIDAPDGRRPRIRTVWQLDHGQIAPRLITAYPLEASHD
jgi:hypothetical protein